MLLRRVGVALCLLMVAGCGEDEPPQRLDPADLRRIVTDDAGVEMRALPRGADRVISLIPAATDFIVGFERGERMIARTRYDKAPDFALLPDVGGGLDPSVERIVGLQPDLVIAWPDEGDRSVVSRLKELGITVYQARIETLEDAKRHGRQIGMLVGARAAANRWVQQLEDTAERLQEAVGSRTRPRVVFVASTAPAIVAGSETFVDSVIAMAGGDNVFGDAGQPWPQVSLEAVARRRPEVVLVSGADRPTRGGGWSAVSGRRESLDPDLFSRPGPQIIEATESLFRMLYPDLSP